MRKQKKEVGIFELLGIAVAEIGMSISDFDSLIPPEFDAILQRYCKRIETTHKNGWKQARFNALYSLAPHSKRALKPKDICTFEWEKHITSRDLDEKGKANVRNRAEELEKKWKTTL